jgi:hypothetical protein
MRSLYRWVKSFIHRGLYGYAISDTWSTDYYLINVILPMLKILRETNHGYPGDLANGDEWDKLLDEMIIGFEAGKRVCDDNYMDIVQPNWDKEVSMHTKGNQLIITGFEKDSSKKCMELELKDQEVFKEKMKIFSERFFNLWN